MTHADDWNERKAAQLARAMAALPGTQTSVATRPGVACAVYRLRYSVGAFEDLVVIGRSGKADATKKGRRSGAATLINLTDARIDRVLARWRRGDKADGLAFAERD